MFSPRMKPIPILFACIMFVFCCFSNANAYQEENAVQPEILGLLLSMAGFETDVMELNREDGFEEAIIIEGIQNVTLLIGFSQNGFKKGEPFLLSVDGAEVLVELSEEGNLIIVDGDGELIPSSIFDFVECILRTVSDLVQDILKCGINPFCYVLEVFRAVFGILGCIFVIF